MDREEYVRRFEAREEEVARMFNHFSRKRKGCRLHKRRYGGKFESIDCVIVCGTERIVTGYAEIKTRDPNPAKGRPANYDTWPTATLDVHKVDALLGITERTGLPSYVLYLWADNVLGMLEVTKDKADKWVVDNRGRHLNKRSDADIKPVCKIPVSEFQIISK